MQEHVIYQVLLSNLVTLAENMGVGDQYLGFRVDETHRFVAHRFDDGEDHSDETSLKELLAEAARCHPDKQASELVLSVWIPRMTQPSMFIITEEEARKTETRTTRAQWLNFGTVH